MTRRTSRSRHSPPIVDVDRCLRAAPATVVAPRSWYRALLTRRDALCRAEPEQAHADADPAHLVACGLDDFAAAWATRLRMPFSAFERRDGEHDRLYRARVVGMIAERVRRA